MQKVIGNLVAQFKEFFKALPPIKRNSIFLATIISAIGLVIIMLMLAKTNYEPLFRNVAEDQLPLIVNNLQKKNVPFTLQDNGKTVLVPKDLLYATQMSIMAELGNTKVGTLGLEIFEKQDFGITSFAQRINFQRAIQGELMRAINTLGVVKQSKVLLALPAKKTFLEEGGQPSASVVVNLYPGKSLTPDQVKGITHLVSSSVENMSPEKVTVVDSRGKVLSKKYSGTTGVSSDLLEIKRQREQELEERIESILSRVVGTGKVIAKVDATLSAQQRNSVAETVDPDRTALRSQTTEEEVLDGQRTNPTGVPGARANLPGAGDQGRVGFSQNVKKELKTNNFAVPKTVTTIKEAAGQLQRVSVAVLVDGVTTFTTNEGGDVAEDWQPRTAEDMQKYENIIRNAIGFDAKRGDSVKIENIRFQKEDFTESEKILTTLERRKILHSLFKWSLLGFSLAMFFFIVVRPFMRWITDSFQESVDDMLPRTIEELEDLQSVDNTLPGMTGALPVLEESIDPNKAESELLRERIMNIVESDVEKSTAAFELWVSRREL